MIDKRLGSLVLAAPVLDRAAAAIGAYLVTAVISIGSIALIDTYAGADQLRSFLVYALVMTIAAGIEPGTGKAAVLGTPSKALRVDGRFLAKSAVKAFATSPLFALIWWIAADGSPGLALGLTPAIVLLGFVATDVRVLIDHNGRHASAIWLKQGSLALGLLAPAMLLLSGLAFHLAIAAGLVARALWTWQSVRALPSTGAPPQIQRGVWPDLMLASAIGSLAASIDRIVALRVLEPIVANGFVFAYELLSKFWLLPYLLAPILFVQLAGGKGERIWRQALWLTGLAGVPFITGSILLPALGIGILNRAGFTAAELALLALAILIAALNQLFAIRLQAQGFARRATLSASAGLVIALVAFPALLRLMGATGLFVAWLIKSIGEAVVLLPPLLEKRSQ